MLVFSNRRLGPALELLVSHEVALEMLLAVAERAAERAGGRWEHELVAWLRGAARGIVSLAAIDVCDIAWSPEYFEHQRQFLLEAIRGAHRDDLARPLRHWASLVKAHPRESVVVGRRWPVHATG
jgi:hypothetical protein